MVEVEVEVEAEAKRLLEEKVGETGEAAGGRDGDLNHLYVCFIEIKFFAIPNRSVPKIRSDFCLRQNKLQSGVNLFGLTFHTPGAKFHWAARSEGKKRREKVPLQCREGVWYGI